MESGLLFYADGKDEYDFLVYDCERLGRYLEFLDSICEELFQKDFLKYYTLTKSEWDADLEGIIDVDTLPEKPDTYDPEEGIKIIDKAISDIRSDKDYKTSFTYYGANDYEYVLKDLDAIKSLLLRAKAENRKWYITVIGEM